METGRSRKNFASDSLDLLIVGELLREPENTFKKIARIAGVDQRTVASRIRRLKGAGVIRRSVEVDWTKLGVQTSAIVGCTTSVGEKPLGMLRDYIKQDPRVIEGYETVGSHQYVIRVLGNDLTELRNSVFRDLEPLTADLTTSIITSELKGKDAFNFVRYLRETRYPQTRSSSWGDPSGH